MEQGYSLEKKIESSHQERKVDSTVQDREVDSNSDTEEEGADKQDETHQTHLYVQEGITQEVDLYEHEIRSSNSE